MRETLTIRERRWNCWKSISIDFYCKFVLMSQKQPSRPIAVSKKSKKSVKMATKYSRLSVYSLIWNSEEQGHISENFRFVRNFEVEDNNHPPSGGLLAQSSLVCDEDLWIITEGFQKNLLFLNMFGKNTHAICLMFYLCNSLLDLALIQFETVMCGMKKLECAE